MGEKGFGVPTLVPGGRSDDGALLVPCARCSHTPHAALACAVK